VQEIFKKPEIQPPSASAKKRKPLTQSQRRRLEKKKHYKERQEKQEQLAKERANAVKPVRPCKFFQMGNCNKVSFSAVIEDICYHFASYTASCINRIRIIW